MKHFKSFDLNFERLFCSFKRKQFDLNCFTQGFSLKTDIHKKFESILFLKLQKVESEIRFENPLCFELNFKKSKMYSVTLQSVILKTLLNHFILKHFENGSKVFLKWVVWKRPIEKKIELSYFKFYLKVVQNDLKIFYKSLKILVQKFATICIWKRITFGFELELSLISKQNFKRKGMSWFQKCISKRSLPKWFERVENYLIWFNSPKVLFQKELEHVY